METPKDIQTDAKILATLLHPSTSLTEVEAARSMLAKRVTKHGGDTEKWLMRSNAKANESNPLLWVLKETDAALAEERAAHKRTIDEHDALKGIHARACEAHAATKNDLEKLRVLYNHVTTESLDLYNRLQSLTSRLNRAASILTDGIDAVSADKIGANGAKRSPRQPKAQPDGLLTMPQVCDLLGCSRFAVGNWRKSHGFPQPDSQHRYDREAVEAWWKANPDRQASVAAKAKRKAK